MMSLQENSLNATFSKYIIYFHADITTSCKLYIKFKRYQLLWDSYTYGNQIRFSSCRKHLIGDKNPRKRSNTKQMGIRGNLIINWKSNDTAGIWIGNYNSANVGTWKQHDKGKWEQEMLGLYNIL